MLKALQLIFEPSKTWETIAKGQPPVWRTLVLFLIPTLIVVCAIESWGLHHLGNKPAMTGFVERPAIPVGDNVIIRYQATQICLLITTMLILPVFMRLVLKSMHTTASYTSVFTTMCFSFAPYFLMIAVDALPALNPILCRGIGSVLVARAFYIGLVRVIKPEPSTALGVYLMGIFLTTAFIALTHFVALNALENGLFSQFLG